MKDLIDFLIAIFLAVLAGAFYAVMCAIAMLPFYLGFKLLTAIFG